MTTDASCGRDRARVHRLRLRLAARLHPRRRLRVDAVRRRRLPGLAADVHGRRQLSGRVQRGRQLPADALLRQQVPADAERRRTLPEVDVEVVDGRRVDDGGGRRARPRAVPIDRRLSRDHLLTDQP